MDDLIPAWAWVLLEDYVEKSLANRGVPAPTAAQVLDELGRLWPELSCTLMVQMPWMGTIRFKRLAVLRGDAMRPFLAAPEASSPNDEGFETDATLAFDVTDVPFHVRAQTRPSLWSE